MKPGFGFIEDGTLTNFSKDKISDSTTFKIQPDSSIYLHSNFGFITFNTKIKEYELQADYLRIETKFDTIVAKDKEEIRKLIYGRRQGSITAKGSNWVEVVIGKKKKLNLHNRILEFRSFLCVSMGGNCRCVALHSASGLPSVDTDPRRNRHATSNFPLGLVSIKRH